MTVADSIAPPDATAQERLRIIRSAESIVLVGVSANPLRSSNFVATYLVRTPYRVSCVNRLRRGARWAPVIW